MKNNIKKQVLFLHGAGFQLLQKGNGDLSSYLKETLGGEYEVLCPIMPNPENPDYTTWKLQLRKELADLQNEVILIGHSLGGSVLLKYFSEEKYKQSVSGLFIIAAPFWGIDEEWQSEQYILQDDFSSNLLQIPRIFLYHSYHDEVVPFDHLACYAEKLPYATVRLFDSYGHYFKDGFPEIIDDIKNM